jgi:predicted dehydrogenase
MEPSYEKAKNGIESGPLRLGVLGCGKVFERFHLPALRGIPDWHLVTIYDPSSQRREWVQHACPNIRLAESPMEFLQEFGLDAVLISSPPETHFSLVTRALKAGLHVLVEKPMALELSEAMAMLDTARRVNKHLCVGFTRRFRRPYLQLRNRLKKVPAHSIEGAEFKLTFDPENWSAVTDYLGENNRGGGVLDDVASHQLDLLPWLFDQPGEAAKVVTWDNMEGRKVSCAFQFKLKNGLIIDCFAGHTDKYQERLEVRLKDRLIHTYPYGILEFRGEPRALLRFHSKLWQFAHLVFCKLAHKPTVTSESFVIQLKAFASIVQHGESEFEAADADSGVRCLQAISACRQSLKNGGTWISFA